MSSAALHHSRDPFLDFIQNQGLLSPDQLHVLAREHARRGGAALQTLKTFGAFSPDHLRTLLARFYDCPAAIELAPAPDLLQQFPMGQARADCVLPLEIQGNTLLVAMVNPHDLQALDHVRKAFPSLCLRPHLALEEDLVPAIEAAYTATPSLDRLLAALEHPAPDTTDGRHPIIRLADGVIAHAVQQRASDIHFEPGEFFVHVRIRVDGGLQPLLTFHKDHWGEILVHLKILAHMNISETRRPQGGRFSKNIGGREVDFRAAAHPTVQGENLVMRILDKTHALLPLPALGLTLEQTECLRDIMRCPEGLIIVTGPTGAGKTTTLYSILGTLAAPTLNIMTLEDPIEYQLPLIRQTEVQESIGLTFEAGVRSILRQDPDVILIGETRDAGTAAMALRAAMTGHQVYTTLHTNDAVGAIARLGELGAPRTLLSGHILGIIAQRLVRILCPHCRAPHPATAEEATLLQTTTGTPLWRPTGCSTCFSSGYKGRTGIFEILPITPRLHAAIHHGAGTQELLTVALQDGFTTMHHHARALVLAGTTSLPEILRTVNLSGETS